MIDLSSMQHEIDMNKREYYLSLHTNEIWKICKGTYDRYENDYKRFFNGIEIENKKVRNISDDELEQFIKDTIIKCNLTQKGYAGLRKRI